MNVVLVLELAKENKKEVAAETGAAKSSYSSIGISISTDSNCELIY